MVAVWLALIVFGFALFVFLILVWRFPDEVRKLISRTDGVEVRPTKIALRFFREAVREKENRDLPSGSEATIERISGVRILWVDDAPVNNRLELEVLRARGIAIDCATSNQEALEFAADARYDLVISDIGRKPPEEENAGLSLPANLRSADVSCPIAFYVGEATAATTPAGDPVFDRPTDLFEFIAGQLESRHSEAATR